MQPRRARVDLARRLQVQEQLHDLTSRIERINRERADAESRTAESFGLGGTPPVSHTDAEFENLVTKMKSKHGEPSLATLKNVEGAHRAPRARVSGEGNRHHAALRRAGVSDVNRLLVLEAWDIIHRGSYGYPGWYDPNNGLYVDPETFYFDSRKSAVEGIADDELASTEVAHDVIRRMVADLQDPYSRFSEPSEAVIKAVDHQQISAKRPAKKAAREGREYLTEGPPREDSMLSPQRAPYSPSHLALDDKPGQRLVGVGLQLADPLDGREDLVVVAPIPNSPAEAAGIQPLDRLLRIDDVDVSEYRLTTGEATNLLRGWEGTDVRLLVQHARGEHGEIPLGFDAMGDRLPRQRPFEADEESAQNEEGGGIEEIVLKRKKLNIAPVQTAVLKEGEGGGRQIGYVRINYFSRAGTEQVASAVREMEQHGVAGYILDVRNCLGGLLKESLFTVSIFQEESPEAAETPAPENVIFEPPSARSMTLLNVMDASGIVRAETLADQRDMGRWPDTQGHPIAQSVAANKPIQVLTNRGTASASEVLAMALAGNGRAQLTGERTFGKALIQHPYKLADGSILTLTVAEYLSPGPKVRHLGAGLLPQSPCHSPPKPPGRVAEAGEARGESGGSAGQSAPDQCIAAAETSISTTLGWDDVGGKEWLLRGRRTLDVADSNSAAGERGGAGHRWDSMKGAKSVLRVPPANAVSPSSAASVPSPHSPEQHHKM